MLDKIGIDFQKNFSEDEKETIQEIVEEHV